MILLFLFKVCIVMLLALETEFSVWLPAILKKNLWRIVNTPFSPPACVLWALKDCMHSFLLSKEQKRKDHRFSNSTFSEGLLRGSAVPVGEFFSLIWQISHLSCLPFSAWSRLILVVILSSAAPYTHHRLWTKQLLSKEFECFF